MRNSDSYACTQWVFLRALGAIYFIAFASNAVQIGGLLGSEGILPVANFLDALRQSDQSGTLFFQVPTLAWLSSSDWFLQAICWSGVLAGLAIVFNVAAAPALVVAWLCYLSLVNVGQDFLSFQWDVLLLEAGFLGIFWCPWQLLGPPWRSKLLLLPDPATSLSVVWLYRWLLFRLMFLSGSVKLLSGDLSWRDLTALKFHYFTQPLPTPLAWLANQLPDWMQIASAAIMFLIELAIPFLFFFPAPWRYAACALTVLLQVMILLTGNYTFFNWLTIALCIPLLCDRVVVRMLPARVRCLIVSESVDETVQPEIGAVKLWTRRIVIGVLTVFIGSATVAQLSTYVFRPTPIAARLLMSAVEPFHIANTYGLFAIMTKDRPEIVVEGSDDGVTWREYVFRYKPGPLDRPPPIVAPFQPRLDWQMWFAALGPLEDSRWFVNFAYRLLQPSPNVLQLLAVDPFGGRAPKYLRADLYDYKFTSFDELLRSGKWWTRTRSGVFMPAVSLSSFRVRQK